MLEQARCLHVQRLFLYVNAGDTHTHTHTHHYGLERVDPASIPRIKVKGNGIVHTRTGREDPRRCKGITLLFL